MPIHSCQRISPSASSAARSGRVIYVDSAATGTDDGSSWTNACPDLQTAITAYAAGMEIWIAGAATTGKTYKPDGADSGNRALAFAIPAGAAIYGGFVGGETRREARNPGTNLTILSGDIGTSVADRSYHVVTAAGAAYLDGLIIEKGNANSGTTTDASGGGIYTSGAGLVLKNSIVRDCFSTKRGAGIYLSDTASGAIIDRCEITRNSTWTLYDTGATLNEDIDLTETEFTAADCDLLTKDAGYLKVDDEWCYYSTRDYTMVSGIVRGVLGTIPAAHSSGASIYEHDYGNVANTDGGGINTECYSALAATITNTLFNGNQSQNKGGGFKMVANAAANAIFSRCVFDGNVAALENGGLGAGTGNGIASNCLFVNNLVISVTGTAGAGSLRQLINCSLYNNRCLGESGGVGGIRLQDGGSSINSVFYGNHGTGGTPDDIYWEEVADASVTYTATTAEVTGTGNIVLVADPFLDSDDPAGTGGYWGVDAGLRVADGNACKTASATGGEIGAYA